MPTEQCSSASILLSTIYSFQVFVASIVAHQKKSAKTCVNFCLENFLHNVQKSASSKSAVTSLRYPLEHKRCKEKICLDKFNKQDAWKVLIRLFFAS